MSDFHVRDRRRHRFLIVDDEFFDAGYVRRISATATVVYLYFCRRSGEDGSCWPAQGTMAKDLGMSERTIRRAITELEAEGLVEVERDTGPAKTSNIYTLLPVDKTAPENRTKMAGSTGQKWPVVPDKNGRIRRHSEEDTKKKVATVPSRGTEVDSNSPETEGPTGSEAEPEDTPGKQAVAIVRSWEQCAGVVPANYGRAISVAKRLVAAGLTAQELPELYKFVSKWAVAPNLQVLEGQIDSWRAAQKTNGRKDDRVLGPDGRYWPRGTQWINGDPVLPYGR